MAGVEISTVYTGIAGGHIKSFNSTGIVAVKDKEITENDVQRVIDAAKAVAIPLDREVIHIIPQEFMIDGQDGIRDPIGMSGVRLEAKVHIVTGAVSSAQNIIKCANKAGLNVAEICLEPIASAEAVLAQDEKELGVVLVDIGGGTSDIAIFKDGAIVHTGVLALGGNHITNDIAVGLRTPQNEAEKIKIRYGCAMSALVKPDETIEVPGVGGRKPRIVAAQAAGRDHRAPGRGDLLADPARGDEVRLPGHALGRRRDHRRHDAARRHAGARRVHLRDAGQARLAA